MKKALAVILVLVSITLVESCKKGCLDSRANNYDEKAKKDDGSCTYGSGTVTTSNEEKETGDLKFFIKNSTKRDKESVELYVNNKFIGFIQNGCSNPEPDCSSNCEYAHQLNLTQGYHDYAAYLVTETDTGNRTLSTLVETSSFVTAGECTSIVIEN